MKVQPDAPMSRRRLMCIGMTAAAGVVAGCGGGETTTVKISSSEKGTPGRLARLKEKADQVAAKRKGKGR